jgi:hypothetical protein
MLDRVKTTALFAVIAVLASCPLCSAALDLQLETARERPPVELRALVPGLVQMQRGEQVKGWAVVAGEVALLAAALEFQLRGLDLRAQAARRLRGSPDAAAFAAAQRLSLSAAQSARFRDGFLVAAAALWALSFVDGQLAPIPSAAASTYDGPALRDRPLMPVASISRRGLVAGISVKF